MDIDIDLGKWPLHAVEDVIEALDRIEDPEPIIRSVLATWKTQILIDAHRAQLRAEAANA